MDREREREREKLTKLRTMNLAELQWMTVELLRKGEGGGNWLRNLFNESAE